MMTIVMMIGGEEMTAGVAEEMMRSPSGVHPSQEAGGTGSGRKRTAGRESKCNISVHERLVFS